MNFDQSLKDSLSQIIKERLDPLFERLSLIETKITRIEEIVFKQQGEKIDSISNQLQSIESKIEILQNELCDKNSLQDTQDVQKEQNNQQCSQAENQVQQNSENNANTETKQNFPQQTPQIELQPLFQFQQEKSTLFFPSIKQNEFPENQSNKLINEFSLQRNQQDPQVDQDKKNLFGIQNSNSNVVEKQITQTSVNKNSSTYLDTMEFLNFLHQNSGASSQKITDSVDNLQNNFRSNQDNHQKNLQPQTSTIHQPQYNQQICLYRTRTGMKCHVEGCKWLRYSKIPISQEPVAVLENIIDLIFIVKIVQDLLWITKYFTMFHMQPVKIMLNILIQINLEILNLAIDIARTIKVNQHVQSINQMTSEEIKKIVQQLLNEKLESLTERITSIEKELLNLKTKLYSTEKESNFQNITLNDKLSLIEVRFQSILDIIESTQIQAKQILDQTDERLKEMEKLKQNQQTLLKNFFMCEQKVEENSGLVKNQLQEQPPFSGKQQQQLLPIQFIPQNLQISQSQGNQQAVFKTINGKKYHKADCEWLKNSQIPIAQQQAIREGLTACFVCKP